MFTARCAIYYSLLGPRRYMYTCIAFSHDLFFY
jgi:hypothetical protein